jgi:hypothetical protein
MLKGVLTDESARSSKRRDSQEALFDSDRTSLGVVDQTVYPVPQEAPR